ncbi:MAG TPA: hypothetical protein VI731_03685, partial [Bacteroidia bacterium]|nr:hypothetical protein [Bacteroidia bacterium]
MNRLRAWIDRLPRLRAFIYFFPVQLLLVQIKKNPVLIIFWLMMFGFITGHIASRYGVSLLFMDPEFIGHVNFFSYFLIGFACGGFIMAYQISCYVYNAFRFPFLATCSRPFLRFCVNNFIIPALFLLTYFVLILRFLTKDSIDAWQIAYDISGFIAGNVVFIIGSLFYFFRTSKNLSTLYGLNLKEKQARVVRRMILSRHPVKKGWRWKMITPGKETRDWHVETYIAGLWRIRRTQRFEHYDKDLLNRVFLQNHSKAVIFEVVVIGTLLLFGYFRDIPELMIPAGASIFLLFTLYLMFTGVLATWFRGWSNTIIVLLLLFFNWFHQFDPFESKTRAYGLNYNAAPVAYSNNEIVRLANDREGRQNDSLNTIMMLENWKQRIVTDPVQKPKMVILSCSGGGLRSSLWTFYTMQYLDSLTEGKLLGRTTLICGSSGGMLGAAFMREIWLREQMGENKDHLDPSFRENVAADMLNPVAMSLAVNDWFLPLHRVNYGGNSYARNRAYEFEQQLLSNTNNLMEKRLGDYSPAEKAGIIPMMVFAPTIVNDGRKMIIASQGVSYLVQPPKSRNVYNKSYPDAVEFSKLFANHNADSVRFSSVLRMNATFPYITPITTLPSEPEIEVFDAGMRDNYGMDNVLRFLFTFRTWINQNTSGVVLVHTRDKSKLRPVEENKGQTIWEEISRPMASFYNNLFSVQDYIHDYTTSQAAFWFGGQLDVLDFELN